MYLCRLSKSTLQEMPIDWDLYVKIDGSCCEVSLRFLLVTLKLSTLILCFEKIVANDMFQLFEPKESPSVQQGALCKPWVGVFFGV